MRLKCKGRPGFPNILEPRIGDDGKVTYGCKVVGIDPEKGIDNIAEIKAAADQVMKDKWQGKVNRRQLRQFFIHDGADKAQYAGFYDGVEYLSLNSKTPPKVVDRDGRTRLTAADGKIYSGAQCVFYFDVWAQDNTNGKGVNASLVGVQFLAHDEPFGGSAPMSDDEFEQLDPVDMDELI